MNAKTKRILLFVVVVILVAWLIKLTLSILFGPGLFFILIAAIIVFWQWDKIKKMF